MSMRCLRSLSLLNYIMYVNVMDGWMDDCWD